MVEIHKIDYIDEIVIGLMETYGTNDPYEILQELDVNVMAVEKDSPLLLGRNCVFLDSLNIIYIIDELPYKSKLFYLRHELGHILLHLDANNMGLPNLLKHEREANYFAYKLSRITLDKLELYQMSIDQIASIIEVPEKVLKQLVNL